MAKTRLVRVGPNCQPAERGSSLCGDVAMVDRRGALGDLVPVECTVVGAEPEPPPPPLPQPAASSARAMIEKRRDTLLETDALRRRCLRLARGE